MKDEAFAGSGVLVGPSLVLTSWHVIAKGSPGQPQEPAPKLEVVLADDQRFDAKVPAVFQSECGDAEYVGHSPLHDADVANRHDVALLELVQPAAAHLGHISLATPFRAEAQEPGGAGPLSAEASTRSSTSESRARSETSLPDGGTT